MTSVAPLASALSRLVATGSTAMMRAAPAIRAPWMTNCPTPPQPTTATTDPGSTRAVLSAAPTPVMAAHPTRASWSAGRSDSTGTTDMRSTTASSAKVPSPLIDQVR